MKDGLKRRNLPTSVDLITNVCVLSGKNLLESIVKGDKVVRFRGKNRNNTALALKSAIEEIIGPISNRVLVETSEEDFKQTLVSFVLPVEKLSAIQKSFLMRRISSSLKRVFN